MELNFYSISAPDGEQIKTLPATTREKDAKQELADTSIAPGMMSGCFSLHLYEPTDNKPPFGPGNPSAIGAHIADAEDGRLLG